MTSMYRSFCILTALVGGVVGVMSLNKRALYVAIWVARSSSPLWSIIKTDHLLVGLTASAALVLSLMMLVKQYFRRTYLPRTRECRFVWSLVGAVVLGELWILISAPFVCWHR